MVPVNENGIVLDGNIDSNLKIAMTSPPFDFTDIFIYSHGWWRIATGAMVDYNRFSVEFTQQLLRLRNAAPPLPNLPRSALATGIHWPSMLSEDQNSIANYAEALSYYTMGKRADTVGQHGVYALLRVLLEARADTAPPLRIHLIGHSFGCRVVCSALEQLTKDTIAIPPAVILDAVLLQAAFDNDDLEASQPYGDVSTLQNFRILVTRSDLDTSLMKWYPEAERLGNFFFKAPKAALGGVGPTQKTVAQFGGSGSITVDPAFTYVKVKDLAQRLIVADLTPLHRANPDAGKSPFAGHHSDIFYDQIYQLIAGFLYR